MNNAMGLCPVCHETDGYLNLGRAHWFVCEKHKLKWFIGDNLFSSWMYETPEEQLQQQKRIGFDQFAGVESFLPFGENDEEAEFDEADPGKLAHWDDF